MARSILGSFVSGTRQVLVLQLFISIGAVALAGWTLGVTNDLIRERNRLKDRVVQLEQTLAASDIVVPPTAELVNPPTSDAYPPSVTLPEDEKPEEPASEPTPEPQQQAENEPTPQPPTETPLEPTDPRPPTVTPPDRTFNPGQILGELFAPVPPLRTVVLHARSAADARVAQTLAAELTQTSNVRVAVDVLAAGDARQPGYSYFDGRQSRAASALMQRFHDIARRREVAAWSAQLRGVALPAQGEFTADRLDIVLPPLPTAPTRNLDLQRIDPRVLQRQTQPQQPTIR